MSAGVVRCPYLEHRESEQTRRQYVSRDREIAVSASSSAIIAPVVARRVSPLPPEALRESGLHQTQLPGLGDQRGWNLAALVGGPRRGPNLLAGKGADSSRIICCSSLKSKLSMVGLNRFGWSYANPHISLAPAKRIRKHGPHAPRATQTPPRSSSRRRRSRSRARRYVVGGSSTLVGGGTGLRTLLDGDLRLRRMGLRDRILRILIPESLKLSDNL